jgi:pyrroloquinoline quinone biosynthesis protein B
MRLIVIGTGAGGGCPQWNCGCENCNFARNHPEIARTTDSLAIAYEQDGETCWAIVNPGVDLRHQLARHPELQPPKSGGIRQTPIRSVILTDGELDHTMGLINLREGAQLKVFATASVLDLMETVFPVRSVLKNYANLEFSRIIPGVPFLLGDSVRATAIALSGRQPKYAGAKELPDSQADQNNQQNVGHIDAVIGLKFEAALEDADAIAYAPQIGTWDRQIETLLYGAEVILVDGTFYTSDELCSLGVSAGSAEDMGHLPLSGHGGILAKLKETKARVKLLTHINNTNPILRDNSPERQAVENAGVKIAVDGMCLSTSKVGEKSCD